MSSTEEEPRANRKASESTSRKVRSLSLKWVPLPQAVLWRGTHMGDFLLWTCFQQGTLVAVHLPRIQEIKHRELHRQGLRQPLGIVHDVVVKVSAVGVEHQVLFMCGLDHGGMAVTDCKRATSIISQPHQIPPQLHLQTHAGEMKLMKAGCKAGRGCGRGKHRDDVLEWKVLRESPAEEKHYPEKPMCLERCLETSGWSEVRDSTRTELLSAYHVPSIAKAI